jgi:GNAT superfamily N-acetyltransferase
MTPDVRITLATEADVPTVLRMIRALAEYEQLAGQVMATEEQLHRALFGARPSAEVLLARVGDATVGFAVFFHNFSTFLGQPGIYLEDLFVQPEWRGHGIGQKLFGRVAELAVDRRCGRMEWAVLDWNAPAIEFYRKRGAEPLDGWTLYRLTGPSLDRAARGETATRP